MNATRAWTLGAVAVIVGILGIAYAFGVQPQLTAASFADTSAEQVTTQNASTRMHLAELSRVAATQSTLDATNATLTKAVPSTLKLNTFTRVLRSIAALDQVTIQAISPGVGVAYAPPASAVPAPAVAVSTGSSTLPSASPTPTTTAAAGAAAAAAAATVAVKSPWFGKTDPLITSANFSVIPVTMTVTGTDAAVLAYSSDVQKAERLFAVSAVTTTVTNGVSTAVLTGSIYALDR